MRINLMARERDFHVYKIHKSGWASTRLTNKKRRRKIIRGGIDDRNFLFFDESLFQ